MENNSAFLPLSDAHTHIQSEADLKDRIRCRIPSLISNTDPQEYASLTGTGLPDFMIPTFGLHPWWAEKIPFSMVEPVLQKVSVIGEIGMDSVWCDVPLSTQQDVFERQLAIARELGKPVILHTKGQEKEIAELIRQYPNKYLVHWYSSDRYLEKYLDLDCYFSIGPDVWWNPATRNVAENVPSDRILSETDGLEAVKWAYEEAPAGCVSRETGIPQNAGEALTRVLRTIAEIRRISIQECAILTERNLIHGFLNL